jgi:hypothetical protein
MKLFTYSERFLATIAVLSLTACYKDEIIPEEIKKNKDCQISRIHFNDPSGAYDGQFFYNSKGDPDSVKFDLVGTGFPNIFFVYDNMKDLTQTKLVYSNGTYEVWHRYGYTNKTITTDTAYTFGNSNIEPEPNNFISKRINYIEYDNNGRIIRETEDYISPEMESVVRTYTYDDNGNLQVPGADLQYDDKVNLHSVHVFWQLLARDFSVNNPIQALVYNESGLPLLFDTTPSQSSKFRFLNGGRSLERSVIKYDCKKAKDIYY